VQGATLTKQSAAVNAGSSVIQTGDETAQGIALGSNISGEWTYKSGLSNAAFQGNAGVSTAGFSIFGPGDTFQLESTHDRNSRNAPDGIDYALVGTGYVPGQGGNSLFGKDPLIQSSALFTWTVNTPDDLTIGKAGFQYGTALTPTDPCFGDCGPQDFVPEPMFYQMGAMVGLGGLGIFRIRRRKTNV